MSFSSGQQEQLHSSKFLNTQVGTNKLSENLSLKISTVCITDGNQAADFVKQRQELVRKIAFANRQDNHKSVPCNPHPIDVDAYCLKSKVEVSEPWIPLLKLSRADHNILLSNDKWVTDDIVNAAQTLLKCECENKTISGFQDVACGLVMNFTAETTGFIQILFNGSDHWTVISTVGVPEGEVHLFDSKYTSSSSALKMQIACLVCTNLPHIKLCYQNVQVQSGAADCGIFSIAFATALVFNRQPGEFFFDQDKMRSHLIKCFEEQSMSIFPVKKMRRGVNLVKRTELISVFCICRMPAVTSSNWIECSSCKDWYHTDTCVKVSEKEKFRSTTWLCMKCKV